ncbi:MAG: sirohydrochlorin cobaltochelatase [Desulfurivibrio sp.]|nr:sirohydrochlorin cobaltochelatase [Desulfurivibrio sp.]
MRKIISIHIVLILYLLLFSVALAHSHGHHEEEQQQHHEKEHQHHEKGQQHQQGILLVTFGSSYPQAQAAFDNIEARAQDAFPEKDLHWAYTSHMVRKKLAKEGIDLDSPVQALANMMEQGYTHVAVQSLHTIPGAEFHDLRQVVGAFRSMPGDLEHIQLGYPLLSSDHDLQEVSQALLQNIPRDRGSKEAVIFLGHGTHHPSNAFYNALACELQQQDPLSYMGTVHDTSSLEGIIHDLQDQGVQKAYLMPFMSVAGDHVRNDMAGDDPDSLKSLLQKVGIDSESILKGTAEYDNIVDIWLEHLEKAYSDLEH